MGAAVQPAEASAASTPVADAPGRLARLRAAALVLPGVGWLVLFFIVPLLLIFVALAAATVWYVGLPAFDKEPQATRTCEVIVLGSGSTKCVRNPVRPAHATPRTPKHARR